jgi:hypothetical protein
MITVKECTKSKEWDNGKGQKVPIYKVELSDGTFGESFGKEIPIGTNVSEITIEEGQYGKKFKWAAAPKNGFAGGGRKAGNESFALSYAKDYAVALIGQGKEFKSEHIIQLADKFFDWLESKKK